mmetsp:Transcript_80919/g.112376  ORF Transcript_80919/g.112376 Transcript_80919/m.112376 type:complete len:150 (+) Transcript_80919:474-923(+)
MDGADQLQSTGDAGARLAGHAVSVMPVASSSSSAARLGALVPVAVVRTDAKLARDEAAAPSRSEAMLLAGAAEARALAGDCATEEVPRVENDAAENAEVIRARGEAKGEDVAPREDRETDDRSVALGGAGLGDAAWTMAAKPKNLLRKA